MKIHPKTKENFKAACLSQSAVANLLGLSVSLFNQVLNGRYPALEGKEAQKAIAFLRDRGLLVVENEDGYIEAATVAVSEVSAITVHQ